MTRASPATSSATRSGAPGSPSVPRTSRSPASCASRARTVGEEHLQLGGHPLGARLPLEQLRDHLAPGQQVDQREAGDLHEQPPHEVGEPGDPVDDDHRAEHQPRLQRGGAALDDGAVARPDDLGRPAVDQRHVEPRHARPGGRTSCARERVGATGHHEPGARVACEEPLGGPQHVREDAGDLAGAAPGHQRNGGPPCGYPERGAVGLRRRGWGLLGERMAHEARRDPGPLVGLRLEGEDAEHAIDHLGDLPRAAAAARPRWWATRSRRP